MFSVIFGDQHRAHPLGIIAVVVLHITRILGSCHVFNFFRFVHSHISSLCLFVDIQMVPTILGFLVCLTDTF